MLERRGLLPLALTLFIWAWTLPTHATEPEPDWYARVWHTEDGLPSANVTGVAQTKDGYLWLATQSGLARFDGIKAEEITVPLGHGRPILRTMLRDHADRFWLGEDNGIVVSIAGDSARMFTPSNGLPDATALQIVETPDRSVWIAYSDGSVCRISYTNSVTRFDDKAGLPTGSLPCSLAADAQGVLWFAKDGWAGIFNAGKFERLFAVNERYAQIQAAHGGGIWIATSTRIVKCQRDSRPLVQVELGGAPGRLKITTLLEDSAARLWIGTAADGLLVMQGTNTFAVNTSQNNIHSILEDREGSIWVGTDGGGLDRLRRRTIEVIGRSAGLPFETVRSLCEDHEGDLWVVTQDGALTRLTGERWGTIKPTSNWPGGQAHCVETDKAGAVWIGMYLRGLYRWEKGKFSRFTTGDGLGATTVRSLLAGRAGDLWIGLESGAVVQRFHDGQFESYPLPERSRAVRAMVEDASGQIWMGTLDGRLLRLRGQVLEDITRETGELSHPIRCMNALPDGSVWIGYAAGGLVRFKDGHFIRIRREDGLYDNNICALMEDGDQRMWFAGDRGLFYAKLPQLNAQADGHANSLNCVAFGRDDGLPGIQGYYGYSPGALRTTKGEILFPTHSGIAVVHPERSRTNAVPPVTVIEKVSAAGVPLAVESGGQVARLGPGLRNLEVTFTAPSFIAPEQVRFQYRLDGWDDSWVESGRERKAEYARLPPGDYVFHVIARNNSGVQSRNDVTFHFVLAPYFWQSPYFGLLIIILFTAGLTALVWRLSLRRARLMLKRAEQESALQKERERIAQDMHDELGAQFTQISLLGELARTALPQPEKSGDFLDKISAVARSGVKSLDEIVWAVNPRNDKLADLLDYTGQFALNFLSAAGLECRLDFPENPPNREVSGDVRHSVFLIVKEALNNVVRHAQASRVRIVFDCDEREMRWAVEDNGLGFAETPDNALADGLRNMRQRTAALGGEIEVKTAPGHGTKIRLTIPWHE